MISEIDLSPPISFCTHFPGSSEHFIRLSVRVLTMLSKSSFVHNCLHSPEFGRQIPVCSNCFPSQSA